MLSIFHHVNQIDENKLDKKANQMLRKLFFSFFSERRLVDTAKADEYTTAHGKVEEFESRTRERNSAFRQDVTRSLRDILLMLLVAAGLACIAIRAFSNPTFVGSVLTLVGAAIAAFATLGRVGWKIQSLEGDSIVEQLNGYWFRLLYRVSVTLVFVGAFIRMA